MKNDEHRWSEAAASYVLDALDVEEKAAFEAHLDGCAECRADVTAYRETAGWMAFGASAAEPPAELRERILREAKQVRPLATARPPTPSPARPRAAWVPAALAASLVFALTAVFLYALERGRSSDLAVRLATAEEAAAAAANRVARLDSLVAERDTLLATLLAADVRTANLAAQGRPPSARLYWNRTRGVVVVAAFDLPPAPAGRTYQLWGIATGSPPVSLGTFNTDAGGRAAVALPVDPDVAFQVSAVTEEPAGGSAQPTMTPFLIGSVGDR